MPGIASCTPNCCDDVNTVNTPGSAGQNAYTETTESLTIVASPTTTNLSIGNSDWLGVNQVVFISDGSNYGHFRVTGIPDSTTITVLFLDYEGDSAVAAVIASGATVSASGTEPELPDPLPIANGGTGAASKSAAIAALGVGQDATADNNAGLAYDITNAAAQITGVAASVPITGLYRLEACVSVDYTGTTFASNRTLTITIRNATAGTNLISVARNTGIHTTTTQPTIDYYLFTTASVTAADSIQVFISLDTVESAGSSVVSACNLLLTPIAI